MTALQNEIINQIAFLKSHKCAAGFVFVCLAAGHGPLVPSPPLPRLCCGSLPPHSLLLSLGAARRSAAAHWAARKQSGHLKQLHFDCGRTRTKSAFVPERLKRNQQIK